MIIVYVIIAIIAIFIVLVIIGWFIDLYESVSKSIPRKKSLPRKTTGISTEPITHSSEKGNSTQVISTPRSIDLSQPSVASQPDPVDKITSSVSLSKFKPVTPSDKKIPETKKEGPVEFIPEKQQHDAIEKETSKPVKFIPRTESNIEELHVSDIKPKKYKPKP